jgi:hypothetical protein
MSAGAVPLRARLAAQYSRHAVLRCSGVATRLYRPPFQLPLRAPHGAPLPGAPPWRRHRALPGAGERLHGAPERLFAPHWRVTGAFMGLIPKQV